jgi:hypothetical protein
MSWADPDKIPPALWAQMNITRERFAELAALMEEREKRAPAPGSPAPDFALRRLGADRGPSAERVRLSELRGRPVALVFGSYT